MQLPMNLMGMDINNTHLDVLFFIANIEGSGRQGK